MHEITEQPLMILLAGPNGAGKTTFRKKFLETNPRFSGLVSLNWDDETTKLMARHPELSNTMARIDAGKNIIEKTSYCIEQTQSFIYETVAANKRHLRLLNTVKNSFYKVVTVFIGLASPDLSKQRVKNRVRQGGHSVSPCDIEIRYPKAMANFPHLLSESDTCFFIDNSGVNFKLILLKSANISVTFSKFPNYLIQSQFDMSRQEQADGTLLLSTNDYNIKTQTEKQKIIQKLLEIYSINAK